MLTAFLETGLDVELQMRCWDQQSCGPRMGRTLASQDWAANHVISGRVRCWTHSWMCSLGKAAREMSVRVDAPLELDTDQF